MLDPKTTNTQIQDLRSLGFLVETYKIISSMSMRRIRGSVLANRAFHQGLNDVFGQVKYAYEKEMLRLARKRGSLDQRRLSLIKRNGKTVFVLLSANTGLYGEVIHKVFELFWKSRQDSPGADLVVVGKLGKEFIDQVGPGAPYVYFDFPDNRMSLGDLKRISSHLHEYENVVVFHGEFKTLFRQIPKSSHASGQGLEAGGKPLEERTYIFEPSLEGVVIFFEAEIFASFLEQFFHESRLSKLASRLMLLDRSGISIEGVLAKTLFEKRRIEHLIFNQKQLNSLSGFYMWG